MALDATSFEASTSEHLCRPGICSTFQEFHLNKKPVVASLRPRSSSTSTASSNDLSRVGKCPRRWDESILHLLGDLEGTQLFKRHLEHLQLGHYHKFYHFCDNFKKRVEESAPTVKLRKMINLAYENYIEAGKNLHIQCLDSDVRAAIARRMAEDKIEITMFDAAQKQVLDFLQQTSYMSFFESESYLRSDVHLDFLDYIEHQNSAEVRRRMLKSAPIKNWQEHRKNGEVAQHHDHLARNECRIFFAQVERALNEVDPVDVTSPATNTGALHRSSQNNEIGDEKAEGTLMRQYSENVKDVMHNRCKPSPQSQVKGREQNITSCKYQSRERKDELAADLKEWDFGPETSTDDILNIKRFQSNAFKQHRVYAKSHDQECSDQSILDDHCSKVFDNSPSPPKDRRRERTMRSNRSGVGFDKNQAGYKMPSWQGELYIFYGQHQNENPTTQITSNERGNRDLKV